ncbi:hypothetical protein [Azospirillum sp. TSH64]|uniref:hypothetical protein n=1 Tax=Azospirillum sp. TSH64 TaxID=652740 RepID=UPI000D60E1BC|nr:hypothetical protein [Azospirillum sp. TSH64]PWC81237.1 hypothetical protein TSH64_00905 [Azospirillum sp. TSH64]
MNERQKSRRSNFARRAIALAIVTISATACAPIASNCPPVVEYPSVIEERAANELDLLPPGSAIEELLADYYTLRAMVRACR